MDYVNFKYENIKLKLAFIAMIVLGSVFGITLMTFAPIAIAYLVFEKKKANIFLRPLCIGAWIGFIFTYVASLVMLSLQQGFSIMNAFIAMLLWVEGLTVTFFNIL